MFYTGVIFFWQLNNKQPKIQGRVEKNFKEQEQEEKKKEKRKEERKRKRTKNEIEIEMWSK